MLWPVAEKPNDLGAIQIVERRVACRVVRLPRQLNAFRKEPNLLKGLEDAVVDVLLHVPEALVESIERAGHHARPPRVPRDIGGGLGGERVDERVHERVLEGEAARVEVEVVG